MWTEMSYNRERIAKRRHHDYEWRESEKDENETSQDYYNNLDIVSIYEHFAEREEN